MSNGHDGRQKADSIESASFCCGGKLAPSSSFFCKVFRTLDLGLDLQAKVFISLGLSVKYSMQRETARNASHSGRSLVLSLLPVYGITHSEPAICFWRQVIEMGIFIRLIGRPGA